MTIKEMPVSHELDSIARDSIIVAIAAIRERISNLPKEDRDDLFKLVLELPKAQSHEEALSVWTAMREILEDGPVRVRAMDLTSEEPSKNLAQWLTFVSDKIRSVRKAAGMTQDELAEKSGLPQSHISRLEAGKHSPSRITLEKIAAALSVPLGTFDPSVSLATEPGSE